MSTIPDLPGVLSADEVLTSAAHLAELQTASGMIPWYPGGHCDPWNHVESAMALDVAGFHAEAERAYEWLADIQRADGSWHNYYVPDGERDDTVEEAKLDTNVCAYLATGVWHHWRCTGDRGFVDNMWPTVARALDWVLSLRRYDGLALWAIEPHDRPWEYALLTGTCSIQHALRCGAAVGYATGSPRPDWVEAADVMCTVVACEPSAFEPKERWAMDWYYPVLTERASSARTPRSGSATVGRRSRWKGSASAACRTSRGSRPPRRRRQRWRSRRSATSPRRPICWRGRAGTAVPTART